MDASIIKEEVKRIMEALNEQLLIVNEHKSRIPQIEIDLMMENVRDLYSALKDLNKINNRDFYHTPRTGEDIQPEKPVVEQKIAGQVPETAIEPEHHDEIIPDEEISIPFDFKEPIRFEAVTEQEIAEEETRVVEPQAPVQVTRQELSAERRVAPDEPGDLFSAAQANSISDKYKDDKKTLNERLQQEKPDNTLGSRLQQNQISDIKTAIGINEKFQFINELFAGSMQDYTMAIGQLNQFRNLEEAVNFIDILKFKYNWDMNADAYRKVMEIVRRRYQ